MDIELGYDPSDRKSIYEYAKELEGKTFRQIIEEDDFGLIVREGDDDIYKIEHSDKRRKGGLGEIVEERHFHYKADSDSRPDFPKAGIELKVTPFKINKNGSKSSKERLIISMINYHDIVNMEFETSNAWEKMNLILLVYYLWSPDIKSRLDYRIEHVYLYHPPEKDLKIIRNDFEIIKKKVVEGRAHELSEGDTLYLGAATKASSSKDRRTQPFSEELAKPRAFSLKNSYMTYLLNNYILEGKVLYNIKAEYIGQIEESIDGVERSIENIKSPLSLEDRITARLKEYEGLDEDKLFSNYAKDVNKKAKNKYSLLTLRLLGVKSNAAEEFVKANISVKNIRVSKMGNIKEHMSFPTFKVMDLVEEDWESAELHELFEETKFLLNVFQKEGNKYIYRGAKFWNMPEKDIEGLLKKEWMMYQNIFKNGVKFRLNGNRVENNIPGSKDTKVIHIRPHASKSAYKIDSLGLLRGNLDRDGDRLPNGDYMTKQCFWLNKDYIKEQIADLIKP